MSGPVVILAVPADFPQEDLAALVRQEGLEGRAQIEVQKNKTADVILYPSAVSAETGERFAVPVRPGLLLDRIVFEAGKGMEPEALAFGPHLLCPQTAEWHCTARHQTLRLTEKETEILKMLHEAAGRVVERKHLLDHVWGYAAGVETHTLETHIYRLRQKIEPDPAKPSVLLTEGTGYRVRI